MRLCGGVLTLLGLVCVVPVGLDLYLVAFFSVATGEFELSEGWFPYSRLWWGLIPATGVAFLIAGQWLLRRNRRMILFLRRFGFDEATGALTYAIVSGLRRS